MTGPSALDKRFEVCVLYFDISKAFDTVPHTLLLTKLIELGLDLYLVRWIKSYLTNRELSVYVWMESALLAFSLHQVVPIGQFWVYRYL